MDTPLAYLGNFSRPEFGELWAEIPNYNRHIFQPIRLPIYDQPRKSQKDYSDASAKKKENQKFPLSVRDKRSSSTRSMAERLERLKLSNSKDNYDKSYSWPNCCEGGAESIGRAKRVISKEELRAPLEKEEASFNATPRTEFDDFDAEMSSLRVDDFISSQNNSVRCPAPSPKRMLKGGTQTPGNLVEKEEDNSYLVTTSAFDTNLDTSSRKGKEKEKEKEEEDDHIATRRQPPPRPEEIPPLNLDLLQRPGREEAAPICSPRLLSPRAQKPNSAASVQSPRSAARAGPDHMKAVPSIQSPRSAFSQKEYGMQLK